MKIKLIAACLVLGAALAPAAGHSAQDSDTDRSSPKAFVKDSVITARVKARMTKDNLVRARHINVDTDKNGVVHLAGIARTQAEADKAVSIAQGVKGVSSVESTITVKADR
jgi:hyperosmotically inducible protein